MAAAAASVLVVHLSAPSKEKGKIDVIEPRAKGAAANTTTHFRKYFNNFVPTHRL